MKRSSQTKDHYKFRHCVANQREQLYFTIVKIVCCYRQICSFHLIFLEGNIGFDDPVSIGNNKKLNIRSTRTDAVYHCFVQSAGSHRQICSLHLSFMKKNLESWMIGDFLSDCCQKNWALDLPERMQFTIVLSKLLALIVRFVLFISVLRRKDLISDDWRNLFFKSSP